MLLQGYSTQEMADTLPTVLNLAAAGGIDLASASAMVTDAMSALGMETSEADTMVDQMAKTASTTNTSVAQLGEGILTIGATAKSIKGGTAELNTALGITRAIPSAETLRQRMDDIGTEGFLVNTELRAGSQHCQCNTPAFLKQTLKLSHQLTDKQLLIRMDAGNDAAENLGILIEDGSWFIVKRNLRRGESKDEWISKVRECCKDIRHPRDGKTVYIGSSWKNVEYTDSEGTTKTITMRIVYEIIERTMDKNGQYLMIPDIECNTIWTNLGWSDDDIINGYHAHGECEQFHSEIKADMDVERLPSGKFDTNELVLELTVIAYNILRLIGQETLKSKRSPKTKNLCLHNFCLRFLILRSII